MLKNLKKENENNRNTERYAERMENGISTKSKISGR